jgi:1-acyl-sn-glycerol-3-phosphate acyltransferase
LAPLVDALESRLDTELQKRPFQREAAFVDQIFPALRTLARYFDVEYRGWQHVPRRGPCLVVGNHSGGAESVDFWFLLYKWVQERGAAAPLYGLAYNLLFGAPLLGSTMRGLGIIPASHSNARRALALGATVCVFPGGDFEVFRPWRERNRIDFGRRTGFIKLAIEARVPVVPMTIHGAHQSTLVLTRGRGIAHATGLDRLRVKGFPFVWSIPFGPVPAFVPSLPLPSKVTVHFGAPLDWSRYRHAQAGDPAVLGSCYDQITARMQKSLDRLAREHPHPLFERLRQLGSARRATPRRALSGTARSHDHRPVLDA